LLQKELRAFEDAIVKVIQGDYFNATSQEAQDFINEVRVHLKARNIRFDQGDYSPISIVMPEAVVAPTAKKIGRPAKLTETVQQNQQEEAQKAPDDQSRTQPAPT
jgi:hypothetical protein